MEQLDQNWGRLAGVAKFFHNDKATTAAWSKGAAGERRAASFLNRHVSNIGLILNDRSVPGTRGNIDHIVIVPSGVWIVDAKDWTGRVEQRDKGGWFSTDHRLYVGGRDRSKSVEGMLWQIKAVRKVLASLPPSTETASVPLDMMMLFVHSEWPFFAKPFRQSGVLVGTPAKLAERLKATGPLTEDAISTIAQALASALLSK
jgi:hypothetical protein